ncbi:hypothetical protein HZA38_04265 [Candidatus Peregrinibacteria bacterium]|nr:hypothetical protein [Candidatus Peregrinibacteria bacterium]
MKNFYRNTSLVFVFFISLIILIGGAPTPLKSEQKTSLQTENNLNNIFLPTASAGWNYGGLKMYNGYDAWRHSSNIDANDTTVQALYFLIPTTYYSGTPYPPPQRNTLFTDMNGDGLNDIVFAENATSYPGTDEFYKFGIFLNKGSTGFNWSYKCVYNSSQGYYGDCAQQ